MFEGEGFDVVGEAADGAGAITAAAHLRPSVVVLDVGLPDVSGLDVVTGIRDGSPGTLVVLVSGRREREFGDRVARSGADAFLDKARLLPGTLSTLLAGLGPR